MFLSRSGSSAVYTSRIPRFPLFLSSCADSCGVGGVVLIIAVAHNSGVTMHINLEYGRNTHHINEAIFVAFGDALKKAIRITSDVILSTKGTLSL
ncbi:hypothetical protein [Paenibacillus periandrae]|uniref:hypothetical protein n=1 Tax=Paenibacillus periandrae TaxID=1761741 RepID=UPI0023DD6A91|nr:hypothetical protein [Paenibacillus periandrae]